MARPKVSEERREAILQAFERCILRKGLAETTLEDVAAEAAQPRSLVRYFIGNREAMITCLIERLLERGEAKIDLSLRRMVEGQPASVVRLLFDEVFADELTNITIIELWHLSLRDLALRERLAAIYHRLVFEVAASLGKGQRQQDGPDCFDTAYSTVSLAFGAAFFSHLGVKPHNPQRVRQIGAQLIANGASTPRALKEPTLS